MAKIKTLVFGGGKIHDWQGVQPQVVNALSAADALEITTAQEDLSILEADNLNSYDVLVFHYTVGTISDAQRDGLSKWLAAGKGYVGIHSAADSFRGDPDYCNLVGGYFLTHPPYREIPGEHQRPRAPDYAGTGRRVYGHGRTVHSRLRSPRSHPGQCSVAGRNYAGRMDKITW